MKSYEICMTSLTPTLPNLRIKAGLIDPPRALLTPYEPLGGAQVPLELGQGCPFQFEVRQLTLQMYLVRMSPGPHGVPRTGRPHCEPLGGAQVPMELPQVFSLIFQRVLIDIADIPCMPMFPGAT